MRSSTTSNGWVCGVAALAVATLPLRAQTLAERVERVESGLIRLSFAAREGVCGWQGNVGYTSRSRDGDWEHDCELGPVRVAIHRREGEVVDLKTYVGGSWRHASQVIDLGTVAAGDAATYLLTLVAGALVDAAKEAINAASVADSATVWPELARIARDVSRPLEVRQHAVFALSQRESDAALDQLLALAQEGPDRELRKRAIFWLGQSSDPRAIGYLTELITR